MDEKTHGVPLRDVVYVGLRIRHTYPSRETRHG